MRKIISIILAVAFIGGCAYPAKFAYPPNEGILARVSEDPKYGFRVAVLPFEEMRGDRNSTKTFWICFLPLAPFGSVHYERPETARLFNGVSAFEFDVSRDLAQAAAESLKESGLFSQVHFAQGGEKEHADLILSGRVKSTRYRGRTYTYCVSAAAPALWVLGLPVGDSTDELEFTLTLEDRGTGKRIWECRSRSSKRITQGLYYRWGDDVKGYAELMERAMNEVVEKLDHAMARYQKQRRRLRQAP
jgi:hypothetical protein